MTLLLETLQLTPTALKIKSTLFSLAREAILIVVLA